MKKRIIKIIVFLAIIWSFSPQLFAQQNDTLYIRRNEDGQIVFARFAINANSDRKMENDTVFLKSILQTKNEDEFRLKNISIDKLGMTHKKFQQYYKGIKVENAEYLVHGKDGHIVTINGDFQIVDVQSHTSNLKPHTAYLTPHQHLTYQFRYLFR